MADISTEDLREEIILILKKIDLQKASTKEVRQILEKKLNCDLSARRKEVNDIVMKYVEDQAGDESDEESSEASESEDEKSATRPRTAATKSTSATKRKKSESEDSDSEPKKKSKGGRKKKAGSDSDSSNEWKRETKPAKPKAKGKGNAFTRPFKLSPELASLMGAESLPRHEVVRKVWAIIKERNLYDPKNKQFAVCDADLQTVMGVKRFRTFGMLKYLKKHFVE